MGKKKKIVLKGSKTIMPSFSIDDHETIRKAAFYSRKSMRAFVHDAALEVARGVVLKGESK